MKPFFVLLLVLIAGFSFAQSMSPMDDPARFWTCSVTGVGTTLTQCQAAAPANTRHYIKGYIAISTTSSGGTLLLRSGTGTNCGTSTTSVFPSSLTTVAIPYAGNTTAPVPMIFPSPIPVTIAHAVCVLAVATNTVTIQIFGFTAS